MSTDFDLKMAYHMGYEDALAKRMPEPSKVSVLGRGTCKVVGHGMTVCDDAEFHWYGLSCGHRLRTLWAADTVGMYCPECGRRVEP